MKISVLVVGTVRGSLALAVHEFERRAARYWKLEVVEVESGSRRGGQPKASEVQHTEAKRLLKHLPDGLEPWALTRQGSSISSTALAEELSKKAVESSPGVTFLVGGAYGLDMSVIERSIRTLSLSEMTLPHELARLMLAEQLYRAGTILRKEPYHKGAL